MLIARVRTWVARLQGGRSAATLAGIASLVAACAAGGPAAPEASPADGDAQIARGSQLRVFSSGVQADTLDGDWREIFPIAVARLEHDDWDIQRADTAARQVVTRWKPMDHMLARLALGDVRARCVVDLAPMPGGRTVVRMRGGLASAENLEAKPVWGTAQAAYRKAARKYLAGVRREFERSTATAADMNR